MLASKPTAAYVLVLNAGSATLKWALFESGSLHEVGRGGVERIGATDSFTEFRLHGKALVRQQKFANHKVALVYILKALAWHKFHWSTITHVGHRIVHGAEHREPLLLNASSVKQLAKLAAMAPIHNAIETSVATLSRKFLPKAKHFAVFDTAWFVDLPEQTRSYALPQTLTARYKIRRYGFHGISHAYVVGEAAVRLGRPLPSVNIVSCHLGSGASVAAVREGKAADTTMGFTPLEGLIMGTRAGDLDPGLVLFLAQQKGLNAKKLSHILNEDSGLKGLAGVEDMREILVRAGYEVLGFKINTNYTLTQKRAAQLALKMFLYRVQKYIGAYAAVLGRVDAIVFTGGIGERNEAVRNLIMRGLPTLSQIPVMAIPTNEELAIARLLVK